MRKSREFWKSCYDAGINELTREQYRESAESAGSFCETLAKLEAEESVLSAYNSLASPSASCLGQSAQATNEYTHFALDHTGELRNSEYGTPDERNCLIDDDEEELSFHFQSKQPSFISDAFPDLIWEPFNPIQQTPHRGTIDPRSHPVSFEEVLRSLAPSKFSWEPSFSIDMAVTRGRGRGYRTSGPAQREQVRSMTWQMEPEQGSEIEPQTHVNTGNSPNLQTEILDNDFQSFASPINNRIGLIKSIENDGYAFQQPRVGDVSLCSHREADDNLEPSGASAIDPLSSSASSADEVSEYEHSTEKKRKRGIKSLGSKPKNKKQKHTTKASQEVTRKTPGSKTSDSKWRDHEIAATSAILRKIREEDVHRVKPMTIDNLYAEASRHLNSQGIDKSASSTRSFWNRSGRSHPVYGYDERRNPNPKRLAVGLQEGRSKKGRERIAKRKAEKAAELSKSRARLALPATESTGENSNVGLGSTKEAKLEQASIPRLDEQRVTEQGPTGQLLALQRHPEQRILGEESLSQEFFSLQPTRRQPPNPPPRMNSEELRDAREKYPSSELEEFEGDYDPHQPRTKRKHRKED